MSAVTLDSNVAVVGGGRWACVTANVLCKILSASSTLQLCSPSRIEAPVDFALDRRSFGPLISIVDDLDSLLDDPTIELVCVARAARDNAPTTLRALAAGKSVLVEKPFALNLPEAQLVVQAARSKFCATGLVFLFAPNLRMFTTALALLGEPDTIEIIWHDPASEVRYAAKKRYDRSLNCIQDVFPHIWSLLRLIDANKRLDLVGVQANDGGRSVHTQFSFGNTHVQVEIVRDSDRRRRNIIVRSGDRESWLDFATEPGSASLNSSPLDVGIDFMSPLETEFRSIICASKRGALAPSVLHSVERAQESIELADQMMANIRAQQWRQIQVGLQEDATLQSSYNARYALTEIVTDTLLNRQPRTPQENLDNLLTHVESWLKGEVADAGIPANILHHPNIVSLRDKLISPVRRIR